MEKDELDAKNIIKRIKELKKEYKKLKKEEFDDSEDDFEDIKRQEEIELVFQVLKLVL